MLTVYKASAGAGKTYTLTFEYIRALLGIKDPNTDTYRLNHPHYHREGDEITNRHRGILAITFTNKATEEMKRRITRELDALIAIPQPGQKDAAYADKLCKQFGCSRQELAETADTALQQLLFDFQNFNVTTIDSFFQRVLRNFARELDRQGDYEVELSDDFVINAAVEYMLDEFNTNYDPANPLGKWLADFMQSKADSGEKPNILNRNSGGHRELVKFVSYIFAETFRNYSAKMKKYLSDPSRPIDQVLRAVGKKLKSMDEEYITANQATYDRLTAEGIDWDKITSYCHNFLKDHCLKATKPETKKLKGWLEKAETFDFTKKGFKGSQDQLEVIAQMIRGVEDFHVHRQDMQSLYKSLNNLVFLSFAWQYVDRIYAENNIVLLSETNQLISSLIDESELPFIYEKMGVQLHHFLIDEFQDTSVMQWENLKPLISNSLSEKFDNLIIGDVKQSIYRFRNSESEILHHRVEQEDFPGSCILRGSEVEDNTNHRSSVDVVRFNNTLFSRVAPVMGAPGYEHVVQAVPQRHIDMRGYIRFYPETEETAVEALTRLNAFAKPKSAISASAEAESETVELSDIEAKYPALSIMAAEIRRQHEEGGYRWADIAILCSQRVETSRAIEYLLNNHPDIPILSDEDLYLYKSSAVKLIISFLRLIDQVQSAAGSTLDKKKDYASFADMMLMISRFEHFASLEEPDADLVDSLHLALDRDLSVEDAVRDILSYKPSSLSGLIEIIINRRIDPEVRHAQSAYLAAFHDYVLDYSRSGVQSVRSFLNWWNARLYKFTIPLGSDIDAVNVMTIHKSKGLEFGCVHLPFASWAIKDPKDIMWIKMPKLDFLKSIACPDVILWDPEEKSKKKIGSKPSSIFHSAYAIEKEKLSADVTNLAYVALTRAISELIVYYNPNEKMGEIFAKCMAMAPTEQEKPFTDVVDLAAGFDPQTGAYIQGSPTVKPVSTENSEPSEPPYEALYDVFLRDDTSMITSVDNLYDMDYDISDEVGSPVDPDEFDGIPDARQRGIILHEILSHIVHADDIDRAIAIVASNHPSLIPEIEHCRSIINDFLDLKRPDLAHWFRDFDRILNEKTIYINLPGEQEERRPDRIVFNKDGSIEIVDFKFTSQMKPAHDRQIRLYCSLLRDMGYDRVSGALWYPLLPSAPIKKIID